MWEPQALFSNYIQRQPVIFHGMDALRGLYSIPANRIAVIHGRGLTDTARQMLAEIFHKRDLQFLPKSWKGEPRLSNVGETLRAIEEFRPDFFIAVGGGSVIDGTKLCRLLLEFPFYNKERSRLEGISLHSRFAAVPTTLGSGAEVSSAIMIIDDATGSKQAIVHADMRPEAVAYNPAYVSAASHDVQAASLLDAVSHLVEGYLSCKKNDMADLMAEAGIRILFGELPSLANGHADFLRLQYAGYLGGMVQDTCLVGAAHAIAHQFGAQGFSHGIAVGILLVPILRWNMQDETVRSRFHQLLHRAGIEEKIFFDRLGALQKLGGFDKHQIILKSELSARAKMPGFFEAIRRDPGGKGNPVPMNDAYLQGFVEDFAE